MAVLAIALLMAVSMDCLYGVQAFVLPVGEGVSPRAFQPCAGMTPAGRSAASRHLPCSNRSHQLTVSLRKTGLATRLTMSE
jgi:hypothetical protein